MSPLQKWVDSHLVCDESKNHPFSFEILIRRSPTTSLELSDQSRTRSIYPQNSKFSQLSFLLQPDSTPARNHWATFFLRTWCWSTINSTTMSCSKDSLPSWCRFSLSKICCRWDDFSAWLKKEIDEVNFEEISRPTSFDSCTRLFSDIYTWSFM